MTWNNLMTVTFFFSSISAGLFLGFLLHGIFVGYDEPDYEVPEWVAQARDAVDFELWERECEDA